MRCWYARQPSRIAVRAVTVVSADVGRGAEGKERRQSRTGDGMFDAPNQKSPNAAMSAASSCLLVRSSPFLLWWVTTLRRTDTVVSKFNWHCNHKRATDSTASDAIAMIATHVCIRLYVSRYAVEHGNTIFSVV